MLAAISYILFFRFMEFSVFTAIFEAESTAHGKQWVRYKEK
jgi:hypothetical protein